MAFTSFYLVAGGTGAADINAGSSTGAAQVTTTNGNWNSSTGAFVAASSAFGSTVVGDYGSVYVDGATVTTYVAKVKTVTDSTHIVLDTTVAYGTAPSTNATARSCTINGAWNTEQVLAAGGLATFTVPQSTKINIKGNLTTAASRTISMAGATTTPIWFSGYNANPGDLDNDTTNTLAKPIWTLGSTFSLTTSGVYQLWSSVSVVASRNGTAWIISGNPFRGVRLRCSNTNSGTNAQAWSTTTNTVLAYCWGKAPTTATGGNAVIGTANPAAFIGTIAEGGGTAGFDTTSSAVFYLNCIALNNTGIGFTSSTGVPRIVNCTVLSSGGCTDAVKWTGTPSAGSVVVGLLAAGPSGGTAITNGINASAGTSGNIFRACNDYYNVTNPEVNLGDMPAFFAQTDSNFPLGSATVLTPAATANAFRNGFPGIFENETFNGYTSIGAVDPLLTGLFVQ